MATPNADLMSRAWARLAGNWGAPMGLCIVFFALWVIANIIPFAQLLVAGPLICGLYGAFLAHAAGRPIDVGMLFDWFSGYLNKVVAFALVTLFTLLWSLLLVVPGIVAALSYSMTFFLLAENPDLDGVEAIRLSKIMMAGHRWKLFCLGCRFFGWAILCVLTFGVLCLWVGPYMVASLAEFYRDLKGQTPQAPAA